ncbi:MAG TPA: DNA polymerase III subunit chi [Steroidobacteraceae bacterium]|nr:DNA polymerase III subunit chi [Steroidobacteraceae bacterium]
MAGSDGISATAGPSGADSSPPGSCAAEPRVDFYVLEDTASAARLKLACRLAEKAYLASQRALIWHTDLAELQALDELLWTFADGSFVPHEWLTSNSVAENSESPPPVLLSAGSPPGAELDFVVNLASDPPPFLKLTRRIAEIVDGDEARRRAGRMRFKAYRELDIEPGTIPVR